MALPQVNVDFSNEGADGRVSGLLERAPEDVVEGDQVLAVDYEGNQCQGRVAEVDVENGLIYLALDWNTWIDREDFATASTAFVLPDPMSGNGRGNGHGSGVAVTDSERTEGRMLSPA